MGPASVGVAAARRPDRQTPMRLDTAARNDRLIRDEEEGPTFGDFSSRTIGWPVCWWAWRSSYCLGHCLSNDYYYYHTLPLSCHSAISVDSMPL